MDREARIHAAYRQCENSHDEDERMMVLKKLWSMGWTGGEVWTGLMGSVLREVSPLKYEKAMRSHLLIGYGEDCH